MGEKEGEVGEEEGGGGGEERGRWGEGRGRWGRRKGEVGEKGEGHAHTTSPYQHIHKLSYSHTQPVMIVHSLHLPAN